MTTSSLGIRGSSWPTVFSYPRQFSKAAQYQPYLQRLQQQGAETDCEYDESDDDFDTNSCHDMGGDFEDYGGVQEAERVPLMTGKLSGGEDVDLELGLCGGLAMDRHPSRENAHEGELSHMVRLFVRPVHGLEQKRQHLDEEEVISTYCEHVSARAVGRLQVEEDYIAIVDRRKTESSGCEELDCTSTNRPQRGGLTVSQLREALTQAILCDDLEQDTNTHAHNQDQFQNADHDSGGERKLVYISDMDATGMAVLAETASLRERESLIEFFYNHIKPGPSVGVTITTNGFRTFGFYLTIPYFALRNHRALRSDPREKPDGEPFRRSRILDPSAAKDALDKFKCLYESQASIALSGIDDRTYTVYGTIDTYYDRKSQDSVQSHHAMWKQCGVLWDPMSGRTRDLSKPIWDARLYFLSAWSAILGQSVREWDMVTRAMKETIDRRCLEKAGIRNVKAFSAWNEAMLDNLTTFIQVLSETTRAWDEFQTVDIGYFVSHDNELEARIEYLQDIAKKYSGLREKLAITEALKLKLVDTNRYVVERFVNFHGLETSNIFKGLGVVAAFFFPFSQAASMFNMQNGVLPFGRTPYAFCLSVICLGLLSFAVYIVTTHPSCRWSERDILQILFSALKSRAMGVTKPKGSPGPEAIARRLSHDEVSETSFWQPQVKYEPSKMKPSTAMAKQPPVIQDDAPIKGAFETMVKPDSCSSPGMSSCPRPDDTWRTAGLPQKTGPGTGRSQGAGSTLRHWGPSDDDGDTIRSSDSDTESDGDLEDFFSPRLKIEFVNHGVEEYFNKHAGASGSAQNYREAPIHEGRGISNVLGRASQIHGNDRRHGKAGNGDPGDDDDEEDTPPAPHSGDKNDEEGCLLACPFSKGDPLAHQKCGHKVLKTISRLKSHLWRCHDMGVHCPICFQQFQEEQEMTSHLRAAQRCDIRDRPGGTITPEQKAKIKKRADPRKTRAQIWFDIFGILFPDRPLPSSPYVDTILSASSEMAALRGFISHEWRQIFNERSEGRLPAHLLRHSQAIQEFSHTVFEDTITTLLDRLETLRQAGSPDDSSPDRRSNQLLDYEESPRADTQRSPLAVKTAGISTAPPTMFPAPLGHSVSADGNLLEFPAGDYADDQGGYQDLMSTSYIHPDFTPHGIQFDGFLDDRPMDFGDDNNYIS